MYGGDFTRSVTIFRTDKEVYEAIYPEVKTLMDKADSYEYHHLELIREIADLNGLIAKISPDLLSFRIRKAKGDLIKLYEISEDYKRLSTLIMSNYLMCKAKVEIQRADREELAEALEKCLQSNYEEPVEGLKILEIVYSLTRMLLDEALPGVEIVQSEVLLKLNSIKYLQKYVDLTVVCEILKN